MFTSTSANVSYACHPYVVAKLLSRFLELASQVSSVVSAFFESAFLMKLGFNVIVSYRHVVLPRELAKQVPKSHLMSEDEWRRLGVQQSLGWVHYMIHEPGEILLKHGLIKMYDIP